jgi:thioredoxin-dependent peroxiredoxin
MPIAKGSSAPDFQLSDQDGIIRSLTEFRGKTIVLYFYPKDDTPGCTVEACEFRDAYAEYEKAGVVILGISPDAPKSHTKFKEKYHLPFPLLADTDHAICSAYGVWGLKKFMGREYDGVFRTTFLIGPDGVIRHVFEGVKPAGHAAEVLAAI